MKKLKLIRLSKLNYDKYQNAIDAFHSKRFPAGESYLKNEAKKYLQDETRYATYLIVYPGPNPEIVAFYALAASSIFWAVEEPFVQTNPCIEISYFSINDSYAYTEDKKGAGVGQYIFGEYILPTIFEIKKTLGISYIILFALPKEKVLNSYKKMGFNLINDSEIESYIRYYEVRDCKLMFYNLQKNFSI